MQLGGSRFFDCYIPALGCDVRVHTDALLGGGAATVAAGWKAEDKCGGRGGARGWQGGGCRHLGAWGSGTGLSKGQPSAANRVLTGFPASSVPPRQDARAAPRHGARVAGRPRRSRLLWCDGAGAGAMDGACRQAAAAGSRAAKRARASERWEALHSRLHPPAPLPPPPDIPNLSSLRNPAGVAPAALPLTLRMLTHVPLIVSSRRSQTSGSPTHVFAKLWLQPLPAAASVHAAGAAAPAPAASQQQQQQPATVAALREAISQGLQEGWD